MTVRTLPPDFPVGAAGDHLGRQTAVEGGVPLLCQQRFTAGQVVEAWQDLFPRTIGAAAAVDRSGRHRGLVVVAFFASPPDLPVSAGRHLLRGQVPVFHRVPLGCQIGKPAGKVIFAGYHLSSGTDRAAAAAGGAGVDRRLPFVAALALPPHLPAGPRGDAFRREGAIFGGMPLAGQFWKERGQIVLSRLSYLTSADRAAGTAAGSGMYRCLPAMAFFTLPPNFALAAIGNLIGGQG